MSRWQLQNMSVYVSCSGSKFARLELERRSLLARRIQFLDIYTVSRKKKVKCFCNISHKTPKIQLKFQNQRFSTKFAAKWCKRFPPHLNNVSILPYESWNDHCAIYARATVELLQKETPEFISLQPYSPSSPDLNPVDNMSEILQEMVYKTRITDLELSTTPLTNGCRSDDMIQLEPLHSQSLFQFVQINDAYFVHLSLITTRCDQLDSNLVNLR